VIRLLFTHERELIIFEIENKSIVYKDRKWQEGIRFIPRDDAFIKKVILSRNRISYKLVEWINEANTGKNLAEWQACKDDESVAEVIIKDAKSRGCVFRDKSYPTTPNKQEGGNNENNQEKETGRM
jgi:hypothetical protein